MYFLILLFNALFCIQAFSLTKENLLDNTIHDLDRATDIFEQYIQKYDKKYQNEIEYYKKFETFKENLKIINHYNNLSNEKSHGLNNFSDLSFEEFREIYLCKDIGNHTRKLLAEAVRYEPQWNAPQSFDWRSRNAVTEIKNQQQCGSCYVFSAIGSIEGQHAKLHSELISLSEQQGLDCEAQGNCQVGGQYKDVWNALANQGGSVREEDYPYQAAKGQCRTDQNKIVVKVTGGQILLIQNEDVLADAVYNYGPLSAALQIGQDFKQYAGSVFRPVEPTTGYHAILIVGYGVDAYGQKYWILKNSWGLNWGEQGYMRMARGYDACNIISGLIGVAQVA